MSESPTAASVDWTDGNVARHFRRYLVIATLAINAVVCAMATAALLRSRANFDSEAQARAAGIARALDQTISSEIDKIDLDLNAIVDAIDGQIAGDGEIDLAQARRLLATHLRRLSSVDAIAVADAGGRMLARYSATAGEAGAGVSIADRAFFALSRDHPNLPLQISPPVLGRISGRQTISLSRRLDDPHGGFAGIVAAGLPVKHFQDLLSSLDLGQHGVALLRDRDLGLIALQPPRDDALGQVGNHTDAQELLDLLKGGATQGAFFVPRAPDGVERSAAFRRTAAGDFVLIVALATRDYRAAWRSEVVDTAALLLLFVLATTGLAWATARLWRHQRDHQLLLEARVAERTRDLDEARRAAEQLAFNKGDFLARMSHEIRTPLNAVLGYAQIGQLGRPKPSTKEIFDQIMTSGEQLLGVINDVLDLSKIDAGMMTVERTDFRLRDLIERTAAAARPAAEKRGLELGVAIDVEVPETMRGDPLRLAQVLGNLLTNAIKFTPRGWIRFGAERRGERIVFRVEDTGIGIEADRLQRVFTPFEQGDRATSRRFGGTGLGLAISKDLVAAMGGEIRVASSEGRGTVFEVELPYVPAAAEFRPTGMRGPTPFFRDP